MELIFSDSWTSLDVRESLCLGWLRGRFFLTEFAGNDSEYDFATHRLRFL